MFNELFISYLKENGHLNDEQINNVKEKIVSDDLTLLNLLKNEYYSETELYSILAKFYGLQLIDVQITEIDFLLLNKFPRENILINRFLPLYETENELVCAISDTANIEEVNELKYYCDKAIKFKMVIPSKMESLLEYVSNKIKQSNVLLNYAEDSTNITTGTDANNEDVNAPIITLCDSIINDAVSRKASDIHIEPFEEEIYVRYRIDGKLMLINKLKMHMFQPLVARFKIMAEMNIAERRLPQDGKISKIINSMQYDFRVSTMPTIHGEKLVIRIYNKTLKSKDLTLLGLNEEQKKHVLNVLERPHGIVLLTGPTGSGKSTSLYAFLRHLNKEDTNIITVEDPVENVIEGINQVQINNKANLTFAGVLRSILRQDPNIIMIGEIRDEETAQIATRAAITGHLVFSTLHTNSAAGVVSRLIDMGVAPYLVADSLLCSISQRLVRKLCPNCKQEHETTPGEMVMLGITEPKKIYKPCGCPVCSHTGYSGRTGVFEILPIDTRVRNIIVSKDYTSEYLQNQVKEYIPSLIDDARSKVLSGVTSLEEFEGLIEEIEASEKLGND